MEERRPPGIGEPAILAGQSLHGIFQADAGLSQFPPQGADPVAQLQRVDGVHLRHRSVGKEAAEFLLSPSPEDGDPAELLDGARGDVAGAVFRELHREHPDWRKECR